MMWADNCWLLSDNSEKSIRMDLIEELLDLDMEPKLESLWWTSTHKLKNMRTLSVGSRDQVWDLPFCEAFDVLGYRFHRDAKGVKAPSASRPVHLPFQDFPMKTKCKRGVQHSHEWQYQLAVECRHDSQGTGLGVSDFAPHIQTSQNAGRNLGDSQHQNIAVREGSVG